MERYRDRTGGLRLAKRAQRFARSRHRSPIRLLERLRARETLTVRADAGLTRPLPLAYAVEHLDHAYALTGHAAQGATVERAFVLVHGEGALQEWGCVACSRARAETRLYLAGRAIEREAHGRERDPRSSPERAARALGSSASEPLALEQSCAARDPTRAYSPGSSNSSSDSGREPGSDSPRPTGSSPRSAGAAAADSARSCGRRSPSSEARRVSQTRSWRTWSRPRLRSSVRLAARLSSSPGLGYGN
jgi:hypothetical protein